MPAIDVDEFMTQRSGGKPPLDPDEFMKSRGTQKATAPAPASAPAFAGNPARNRRQAFQNKGIPQEKQDARKADINAALNAYPGFTQVNKGIEEVQTPGQRKKGASDLIRGAGKFAAPAFLPVAAVAAPAATAASLAAGTAAGAAGEGIANLAGADEGTASLVGDAAGLAGGGLATMEGVPQGIGAAVKQVGKEIPGSSKFGRIIEAFKAGKKAATSGTDTAAPVKAPTGSPAITPPPIEDTKALDDIAVGLGAKDFKSVPEAQKEVIRNLAKSPGDRGAPATPSNATKPARAPRPEAEARATAPEASTNPTPSKSINAMLDDELAARRAAAQPVPAPSLNPAANGPIGHTGEGFDYKQISRDLRGKSITRADIVANREKMIQEGGFDVDRYNRILSEVSQQEKDHAILDNLEKRGITTEAQIRTMSDDDLAKTISSTPRVHGKGKYSPNSGAHSRTMGEQRDDLIQELPFRKPSQPVRAPGSPGPTPEPAPEPEPAAAPTPEPVSQPLPQSATPANTGITATVRTPNQTKAKVRYQISEADDLKTSFEPDYNSEVGHQPRDTSRIGSRQRVEARKADMDPEAMGASRMAGDGAPITNQGHAVTRNHGLQALKENYQQGHPKAQEYRDWVSDNAGLAGRTPEDVAAMKNPVFHRALEEPDWNHDQIKDFADEANQSSTARMSEAEVAKQMSNKLSGSTMDAFDITDDGIPSAGFVRGLIGDLPPEEQSQFFDRNGKVSQSGTRLVRNAVFAKAFPDTSVIERMAESTDSQVRNITTGMLKASPDIAQLREAIAQGDAQAMDIGDEVSEAVQVIDGLKSNKGNIEDWLKQEDMLGRDPTVHSLVDILAHESRRPNLIRDTLKNYVEGVYGLGNPKQQGMFGGHSATKLELLEDAYGRAKEAAKSKRDPKQETLPGSE